MFVGHFFPSKYCRPAFKINIQNDIQRDSEHRCNVNEDLFICMAKKLLNLAWCTFMSTYKWQLVYGINSAVAQSVANRILQFVFPLCTKRNKSDCLFIKRQWPLFLHVCKLMPSAVNKSTNRFNDWVISHQVNLTLFLLDILVNIRTTNIDMRLNTHQLIVQK